MQSFVASQPASAEHRVRSADERRLSRIGSAETARGGPILTVLSRNPAEQLRLPRHSCAMTFTLILILNIVLDVAIIGAVAFVMSRAAKLTPHHIGVAQAARPRAARLSGTS